MSDMPEKVFINSDGWLDAGADERIPHFDTLYVRDDLYDAIVEREKRLKEAVRELASFHRCARIWARFKHADTIQECE